MQSRREPPLSEKRMVIRIHGVGQYGISLTWIKSLFRVIQVENGEKVFIIDAAQSQF